MFEFMIYKMDDTIILKIKLKIWIKTFTFMVTSIVIIVIYCATMQEQNNSWEGLLKGTFSNINISMIMSSTVKCHIMLWYGYIWHAIRINRTVFSVSQKLLCPPHTSRRDETGRFLLVGESRVLSRQRLCGVSKTGRVSSRRDDWKIPKTD